MDTNQKISLTIGIPVYNSEATIRETVDSIVRQLDGDLEEICDLEILICDNCSTDQTSKIIQEEYIKKYPNINIIYHKNSANVGASKNIGVVFDNAKGDYVWLFGDDALYKASILKLINVIKHNNSDLGVVIIDSYIYCNSIQRKIMLRDKDRTSDYFLCRNQELFLKLAKESIYFLSSVVVKLEYVKKIKNSIDFSSFYPQTETVLRLSKDYNCIVINTPLIKERGGSWTNKFDAERKISISFSMVDVLVRNLTKSVLKKIPQYKIAKTFCRNYIALYGEEVKNKNNIINQAFQFNILKKNDLVFYLIYVTSFLSVDLAYSLLYKKCKPRNKLKKSLLLKIELLLTKILSAVSFTLTILSGLQLVKPVFNFVIAGIEFNDREKILFLALICIISFIGFFLSKILLAKCQK